MLLDRLSRVTSSIRIYGWCLPPFREPVTFTIRSKHNMKKSAVRGIAAGAFGAILVWDTYRDWNRFQDFPTWALAVHFLYFQLPLKSRALAFIHPVSFTGAMVVPALYIYTLVINPNYEVEHMNNWELSWKATVCRALTFNFAPLICHALDVTTHQQYIRVSYQSKPKKVQILWSCIGLFVLEMIHEVVYPVGEDKLGGSTRSFGGILKLICIVVSGFSFFLLYSLIIKHCSFTSERKNVVYK